jgi:hypothetical protein
MKFGFLIILALSATAQADILETGKKVAKKVEETVVQAASDLDHKVIHRGFDGIDVPWTCSLGKNDSKDFLPQNKVVKMTMNRFGEVGFKPDIFKTNKNIGNFFRNLFSKKEVENHLDYSPCINDFMSQIKLKVESYKAKDCGTEASKNPMCIATTDEVMEMAHTKVIKSPFTNIAEGVQLAKPEAPNLTIVPTQEKEDSLLQTATLLNSIPKVIFSAQAANCEPDPFPLTKFHCPIVQGQRPARSIEELQPILDANNIKLVTPVSHPEYIEDFLVQFFSFPEAIRNRLVKKNYKVNLIEGASVKDDKSFHGYFDDKLVKTGRVSTDLPGVGGGPFSPTRIVINHLHDHHGSQSLFLHEHGHALDVSYGQKISRSKEWKAAQQDPRFKEFSKILCSESYCENYTDEAFAESFAYYNGCDGARKQMERNLPLLAEFFKNLNQRMQ